MGSNVVEDGGYSSLKDLKLEIITNESDLDATFSLCFWLYLPADSSPFPSTLLRQVCLVLLRLNPICVSYKKKHHFHRGFSYLFRGFECRDDKCSFSNVILLTKPFCS